MFFVLFKYDVIYNEYNNIHTKIFSQKKNVCRKLQYVKLPQT